MDAEDFVADSDEEELELVDALEMTEQQRGRQLLDAEETAALETRSVVTPETALTVGEQPDTQTEELEAVEEKEAVEKQVEEDTVDEEEGIDELRKDQQHAVGEPENDHTVVEQEEDDHSVGEQEYSEEEEDTDEEENETIEEEDQQEEDGVLEVGTTVEVDSRTWPGINKLGGSGRVVRVHVEKGEGGQEQVFYDVRYSVMGGFERHIASEYVHSSKILGQQSNRKKRPRDYYHDDFINEPHLRKMKEREKKREQMMAHPELVEAHAPHRRKRKRPRLHESESAREKAEDKASSNKGEPRKKRNVSKIDEEAFVLVEGGSSSLEVLSRPQSGSENAARALPVVQQSPQVKQPAVSKRRRHRIVESSDEESSDDGENGDKTPASPEQSEQPVEAEPSVSPVSAGGASVEGANNHGVPPHGRKRKHKKSRRLYVGGYEQDGDNRDAGFIQPEGNPDELPEDVVREVGVRLATTKHGLMEQLEDTFAQQQKNMASFHAEQNAVNQKMKDLAGMPLSDLQELDRKVSDLRNNFLKKTMVNAGEDVMDKIINTLEKKRGKLPELLEQSISTWQDELKECSRWVRNATEAVEDAFVRRGEEIPSTVQAEYTSDSSYSAEDFAASSFQTETVDVEPASEEPDFSYNYEPTATHDTGRRNRQSGPVLESKPRRPKTPTAMKPKPRKKVVSATTMDDFFTRKGSGKSFRSNLRLAGRQKILPSDPIWNWAKLARKKQQRAGGTGNRSTVPSSLQFSSGFGSSHSTHQPHSNKASNPGDDSAFVQAQRMHLRDKRFRAQATHHRSLESGLVLSAPQAPRGQQIFPGGICFDEITPERRIRSTKAGNPTIHPSSSKQQQTNWADIFEVVSDDPTVSIDGDTISREGQEVLLAFGHPISGPRAPRHLFDEAGFELEDCDSFRDIVTGRVARLRQRLNDLRLQESRFMESLSRSGRSAADEEGYATTPEWISVVSLEEAYHTAIASFGAQVIEALKVVPLAALPSRLQIIVDEIASLLRQLPDCDSLFSGCKAYFFFFEVASRDAATTPLFTAISRAYWYCLDMLVTLRSTCSRLMETHGANKQAIEDAFHGILPVPRVGLAVVRFLFDLYLYLPSSHRLGNEGNNAIWSDPPPALSLWMLVRSCCASTFGLYQSDHEQNQEITFWTLLQTGYKDSYFGELARCFVRGESCGGYLREIEARSADGPEHHDEVCESQLLALEATWGLVEVLSRICGCGDHFADAVWDARWAVVKNLVHPDKRDFLPFSLQSSGAQQEYRQYADMYNQLVFKRIRILSKQWRPSQGLIQLLLRKLWGNDAPHHADEIVEIPGFLKQFAVRAKEIGNSRSQLTKFVEESDDGNTDSTASLCKIIWIQLLTFEKRAHRARFRGPILSSMPFTPRNQESSAAGMLLASTNQVKSGTNWIWGPQQQASGTTQPAKQPPRKLLQRGLENSGAGKERMSTAVLLTFAVVGVCLECGDEQQLPINRAGKDVRFMEREVDFFCKEILRWTSGKPECEVLTAQALFTFGALLLAKNSTEFPRIFLSLDDRLKTSVGNLQTNPLISSTLKQSTGTSTMKARNLKKRRRLHGAAMSPLYQMRDLVRKMLDTPSSGVPVGSAFGSAVEKSLEHIFGAGMEACLSGAIQKVLTETDLNISMEIFQLVLPRAPDEAKRCLPRDEFDDGVDYANLDLNGFEGHTSAPVPTWTVEECRPRVISLIASNLRLALQQLVLKYPENDAPGYAELYAIDLQGVLLSTCEVKFLWSNLTSTLVKPRNLAPRVLSAALKYNPEKRWLRNVFLRESGADMELCTAWLMGTLDVSALNTTPIAFRHIEAPFTIDDGFVQGATRHDQLSARDSDYWPVLTDGIIYHFLRDNSPGLGAMDPHLLHLLREVASTCKFPTAVRANEAGLHDVTTLYALHLDVFQKFCRSVGNTWSLLSKEPSKNWDEMNKFRPKMVDPQHGIFTSFFDAYKINFRRACGEIDQMNHDWLAFAELFLRQAGVNATGGRSYHTMDDTIKSFDGRLAGLTTMFRFMYQCMDAFLFYCGEMAIGPSNLFFNAVELLFRQVVSAEYPQAIRRLNGEQTLDQRGGVRNVNAELRKGFCSGAVGFVDSVQLFFARQKYPSLLHWFAQTAEIYQTYKDGWKASPLRTLLVNVLDPEGPLGIHSYYSDEADPRLDIDVRTVRREAFYLSCGLFNCGCTKSFEHSRAPPTPSSCARLNQLRGFVLDQFMIETIDFVIKDGATSLLETMVPLCQFVRAVLNHANLNAHHGHQRGAEGNAEGPIHQGFQLSELQPCLEWIVECLIKLVPGDKAVSNTMSCVLLIELCGIVCEAVAFNEHRPMLELINLVELVTFYLQTVHAALSKRTTASIPPLFLASVELSPWMKLNDYQFSRSAFRDLVVKDVSIQESGGQMDSYGISLARASTDLLAAIGRVAQQCKESPDERLRGLTTVSADTADL